MTITICAIITIIMSVFYAVDYAITKGFDDIKRYWFDDILPVVGMIAIVVAITATAINTF